MVLDLDQREPTGRDDLERVHRAEAAAGGAPDEGLEQELTESVTGLVRRLGALELQSLFSGEYDERDAVAEVHAGA